MVVFSYITVLEYDRQVLCPINAVAGVSTLDLLVFYDDSTAPRSIFKEFEDISHIGVLQIRS